MAAMIVHESVRTTRRRYGWSDVENIGGVVIEEPARAYAGHGMEPSGHVFANYRDATRFTFHPYSGAPHFPCARPMAGFSRSLT